MGAVDKDVLLIVHVKKT